MIIEQTVDGIFVDDLVLRERQSRYKKARKRIENFYHNKSISDKEIIECLEEEIEKYRDRIRKQEEYIKELNKEIVDIKENETELKEIEQVEDEDIQEIETINKFADGRLVQSISNYKYRESTCPEIELGLHASG